METYCRSRRLRSTFLALALLSFHPVASGCATAQPKEVPGRGNWVSGEERDHPLAGRVWLPGKGRFLHPGAIVGRAARARFVLLGERHDNPDHHRIQAWVTARLIAVGRRPALVMEMFRAGQQARIDAHIKARPGDVEGLGAAAGWAQSGWPPWDQYAPIARPVVARGLPVIAANLDRKTIRAVLEEGFDALAPTEARALALDAPFADPMLDAMDREIVDAHCGHIDRAKARPFTRAQILRDARFASVMATAPTDGAVLIAGAGHVRRDRGVPYHLERRGVQRNDIFTLGIVEVVAGQASPEAYGAAYGVERPPFDAVWFTPRTAREDPCKAFESINKKK